MGLEGVTVGTDRTGDGLSRGPRGVLSTNRLRVAAGIVLVLAFALGATCQSALTAAGLIWSGPSDDDPAGRSERRLRRIQEILPPRGVVGYRARGPLQIGKNHELQGDDRSMSDYVLAQYVLAPRVLDLGPARPIVIRDDLEPVRVMVREAR